MPFKAINEKLKTIELHNEQIKKDAEAKYNKLINEVLLYLREKIVDTTNQRIKDNHNITLSLKPESLKEIKEVFTKVITDLDSNIKLHFDFYGVNLYKKDLNSIESANIKDVIVNRIFSSFDQILAPINEILSHYKYQRIIINNYDFNQKYHTIISYYYNLCEKIFRNNREINNIKSEKGKLEAADLWRKI